MPIRRAPLSFVLGLTICAFGFLDQTIWAFTYTNTIAQVSAYITNSMAEGRVRGLSVVLVDDQTVVWAQGFGMADYENGIPADADTVYHVGSVSKAFLSTAYMQLLDQGRVNLEAPLVQYIPEFSMLTRFTNSGPVTVRSLLNHHSGIPGDFFNGMITTRVFEDFPAFLINCLKHDYAFAPVNNRYYYCNNGFVLASEALRRITGTNFPKLTDQTIFRPLGMDASSFLPDKPAILNRLAAAYNTLGRRQPPEILNALGSGSMYSSINDQARYIRMILADGRWQGKNIITSNGIDVMTQPQLTNLPLNVSDVPQGLGWDNADDHRFRYAGKVFWKDGATWYHCAFLGISRDLKLGVAVIQNTGGSQCDAIGAEALRWAILEKTSLHWPTNAFVPDPSPLTNRPQAELNALAGLYVGSEGYHKIVAQPGSLTFIGNAHSDEMVSISNLVPRANGWFSLPDSQSRQLAFTNLAGHNMLVMHKADGAFESVDAYGEHYLPEPLPSAWRARTNRVYRIVNMYPLDYFWEIGQEIPKTLNFYEKDGALLAEWVMGCFVMQPVNDNLAFQRGTHYRKGGAMQFSVSNGYEFLNYSSYRFIDEAAIPTMTPASITNGIIPFPNGTQWYWFTGHAGQTYRVRLAASGPEIFLRLTDRNGIVVAAATNNSPADLQCRSNGTYAIAVSAANVCRFRLSLTVLGCRQNQSDYDGDGKADPTFYRSAADQWITALSAAGYAVQTVAMGASASAMQCPADYDGDGKSDPAVYDPASGVLLIRLSSQGYGLAAMPIGDATCVPAVGDYDGDGKADPALYSAVNGRFGVWLSSAGYASAFIPLGGHDWVNVSADYDGDGKSDSAVYHALNGEWLVLLSSQAYASARMTLGGGSGLICASGDYDGDGKSDPTLFQPAGGLWFCALSTIGYARHTFATPVAPHVLPAQSGDYDNDGKDDPALYDSAANVFYVWLSGSNYRPESLRFGNP